MTIAARPVGSLLHGQDAEDHLPVDAGAGADARRTTVRMIVELPEPIRPPGYAEQQPYKLTWEGGVHLLGAGILVIPGRTLDNPEDARAHAAAVLAAAAQMQAMR